MIKNLIILSSLLLFACKSNTQKEIDVVTSNDTTITEDEQVKHRFTDLAGKVFDGGSRHLFIDSTCSFYFACDCCADRLVFNPDSTFYDVSTCIADDYFRTGKYSLSGNTLTLDYNKVCIINEYNWEHEMDSSAIDYFLKDTVITPSPLKYTAQAFCSDRYTFSLKMKDDNRDDYEHMLSLSSKDYQQEIQKLSDIGFLNLLK